MAAGIADTNDETSGPMRSADAQFIDDLVATLKLKSFLIGRGVSVPEAVTKGLAELANVFQHDISTSTWMNTRS